MLSPFSPVDIRIHKREQGLDAIRELLNSTKGLCVLISSSMASRLSLKAFVSELLSNHGGVWINTIPANPSVADVCNTLKNISDKNIDAVLAFGGGSAIDLGKAITALCGLYDEKSLTEENIRKAIKEKAYAVKQNIPALLAVPTTAGTGSEVTRWATVWDPDYRQKLSIDDVSLYPKAAVIVPEFTADMGPELTLSTGLDALSHAMEAFWAKSRTPLSQALALMAADKIRVNLPKAVKPEESHNLSLREEMCLGALLSGLAFSITRTTACHAISYPLTILHHLPHGFAAAMTLGSVMRRNEAEVPKIKALKALFEENGSFETWVKSTSAPVKALTLGSFGIRMVDLPAIADLSFTAGRMDNNPVPFQKDDVENILSECL